jgi:hypothetical protein
MWKEKRMAKTSTTKKLMPKTKRRTRQKSRCQWKLWSLA